VILRGFLYFEVRGWGGTGALIKHYKTDCNKDKNISGTACIECILGKRGEVMKNDAFNLFTKAAKYYDYDSRDF